MRAVGVDLHKRQFTVCFLEGDKSNIVTYKLNQLERFKQALKPEDVVAVETTTNSHYFLQQIEDLVQEVKEVNTFQFKVLSTSHKKTDKNDAQLIALYLSKDLLPVIRRRSLEQKQTLSLANARDQMVKMRTSFINQIHNQLCSIGLEVQKKSLTAKSNLEGLRSLDLPETTSSIVEVFIDQILSVNEGIKKLEKELHNTGAKLPGFENLFSIKGIGKTSAAIFASVIGNIEDFENEKRLASYFGIVPCTKNSADKTYSGRITRKGNSMARKCLVQCAWVSISHSPFLRSFYDEKKKQKGVGKAIVATARKLLTIIYHTLKNDRIFTDFKNNLYRNRVPVTCDQVA